VRSHMNTSPCTSNAKGDAPQLTSKETRLEARYASNLAGAFEDQKPTHPGGTPSGRAAAMGYPRLIRSPLEPRGSLPFNTKKKRRTREKEQGRDVKSRVKSSIFICRLCVVQSAVTSHLFMRWLDFPYKKRTKNPVQNVKNPN
jgi:hypothetical protein